MNAVEDDRITNINLTKSPIVDRKYNVQFEFEGYYRSVNFGKAGEMHFEDCTSLKLYSHLNSYDMRTLKLYRRRARLLKNSYGKNLIDNPLTSVYWSARFLF